MNPLSALSGAGGFSASASSSAQNDAVFGSVSTGGGTVGQFSNLILPGIVLAGVLLTVVALGRRN